MNDILYTKIKQIIEEQGEAILSNFQQFKTCFDIVVPYEPKAERKSIELCIKYDAYNELKTSVTTVERKAVKAGLAQKIYEEEGLDTAFCIAALDILESVIYPTNTKKPVCKYCGNELDYKWISCPFCGLQQTGQQAKNAIEFQVPQINLSRLSKQVLHILKIIVAPFYCYFAAYKKYAVFEGRTNRTPFLCFTILDTILTYLIFGIEITTDYYYYNEIPWVSLIYLIISITPKVSLCVRRMYDINKSGWYILCPLYNVILALLPGTKGDNQYGTPHIHHKKNI